ncbi:hypothetical protein CALCODRAFT_155001 [Calocera cornea HHB12733]|uniref:F-box domain-containing protein n=1 Tax=Calocera cornea HHB12733 TaxID=1353952 RepID=A0A165CLU9_9BASI|nr:hypothetical protein CALCODRAFT_155001 [Calocera cornea HHB12733]
MRLPDEVLRNIFLYCHDAHAYQPSSDQHHFSEWKKFDVQILTHVCRRWRAIALDQGYVWTEIVLRSISKSKECRKNLWYTLLPPSHLDCLLEGSHHSVFLNRSKHNALNLSFDVHVHENFNPSMYAFRQLLADGRRIGRINIKSDTTHDEVLRQCFALIPETLEWLTVGRNSRMFIGHTPPIMNGADILSRPWLELYSLKLAGVELPLHSSSPYLPLPRLRHLELAVTELSEGTLDVLYLYNTTLELLTLRCSGQTQLLPPHLFVPLPRLQHLTLAGDRNSLLELLPCLRTVPLECVDITDYSFAHAGQLLDEPILPTCIATFLHETASSLRVLSFTSIAGDSYTQLRETLPTSTVGCIRSGALSNRLPWDVKPPELERSLPQFPNLQELVATDSSTVSSLTSLLYCVEARKLLYGEGTITKPIRRLAASGRSGRS